MQPTFLIRTFGCQMNEHDSERIGGVLMADGMTATDDVGDARVIVLNTCAIRENADNKLYGNLGPSQAAEGRRSEPADRGGRLPRTEGSGRDPTEGPVGRRRRRHARPPTAARPVGAVAHRWAADGRARVHRDLPERAAGRTGRRVPGLGLDRAGLRQRLHLLHRAARAWPAAIALDRGHPGRGAGTRGGGCGGGNVARPEREHVRSGHHRARFVAPATVRRPAADGQSG